MNLIFLPVSSVDSIKCFEYNFSGDRINIGPRQNQVVPVDRIKMMLKKERGQWGGKREGSGKPRSDKPRCKCGAMTAKRAVARGHKCPKRILNSHFIS